jgi:DNA-binding PucR family transcriptional regulator
MDRTPTPVTEQHLAAEPSRGPVATLDDVRAAVTLRGILALMAQQSELQTGLVTRLREHDQQRGTDYVTTLHQWVQSCCDVTLAARSMNVHSNTLRYRLRAIARMSGTDLRDSSELTIAWLHLKMADQGMLPPPA